MSAAMRVQRAMSATHGRSEGALTPSGGGAQRLGANT